MAELFRKQADKYAQTRPTYPPELFEFIASKTPNHDLAWDVGTGNGQAAVPVRALPFSLSLWDHFHSCTPNSSGDLQKVSATAASQEATCHAQIQTYYKILSSAPRIAVHVASPHASTSSPLAGRPPAGSLPTLLRRARLRRPPTASRAGGYTVPRVSEPVDSVFRKLYEESAPFWAEEREFVNEEYRTVEFPFEAVEGMGDTGPVEFVSEREMDLSGGDGGHWARGIHLLFLNCFSNLMISHINVFYAGVEYKILTQIKSTLTINEDLIIVLLQA
ncbi:uncharacterized protein LOC109846812 [Asparagus officinalis]|uniref:uncharacterized protein LOC109846812 n=1 Tax=Asparagus officinalis TaxID=4686 RepID=UPI00098E0D4A|nr:uncharacterized protein LOC109846812 [Asparagus officinalis]